MQVIIVFKHDYDGYLVEVFGMPAFFHQGTEELPSIEEAGDVYYYIKVNAKDVEVDNDMKHFTGSALAKPEYYFDQKPKIMESTETVGFIVAFGKILSGRVNWAVLDHFSIQCLHDTSNPMKLSEFMENRIIRFRSQHHSTATMSALTDTLLFGLISECKVLGKHVVKSFNHYDPKSGKQKVSEDIFYVEFSLDDTEEYSHVHLPYEYWGRLDVPIVDQISDRANEMQPNSSVLLRKIENSLDKLLETLAIGAANR